MTHFDPLRPYYNLPKTPDVFLFVNFQIKPLLASPIREHSPTLFGTSLIYFPFSEYSNLNLFNQKKYFTSDMNLMFPNGVNAVGRL